MSSFETEILEIGRRAREAASGLRLASPDARTAALNAMAQRLRDRAADIVAVNEQDVALARSRGLMEAQIDRLRLDAARTRAVADGVEIIAQQPDPIGATIAEWTRPNGLRIQRVRTPIGVIGMIYESRPNVTA
ncbi:MAG: gamma-glutamyl-phosphate reductase, partial [Parvularculaceae bacterium]